MRVQCVQLTNKMRAWDVTAYVNVVECILSYENLRQIWRYGKYYKKYGKYWENLRKNRNFFDLRKIHYEK